MMQGELRNTEANLHFFIVLLFSFSDLSTVDLGQMSVL